MNVWQTGYTIVPIDWSAVPIWDHPVLFERQRQKLAVRRMKRSRHIRGINRAAKWWLPILKKKNGIEVISSMTFEKTKPLN